MRIEVVRTRDAIRVFIAADERKEFLATAEVLRAAIPTKYRRFDLDNNCWLIQFRAVKFLEKFLSHFSSDQISRREDIQLTPAEKVHKMMKSGFKLHKSSA